MKPARLDPSGFNHLTLSASGRDSPMNISKSVALLGHVVAVDQVEVGSAIQPT
jgi:hypothetical protein